VLNQFLAVEGVSVSFGKGEAQVCALHNSSLAFAPGTLSLITGPSGSGKTTLLSLLGCLLSPDEGSVFVDGLAVHALDEQQRTAVRREKISFVFKAFLLLHSLSAIENVALAHEIRCPGQSEGRVKARDLLSRFGLEQRLDREPDELSPGEKQRVAVARALVSDPPIILADEPTASLDEEAGKVICQILRNEVDQNGRTVVVVSHDPRWQDFADRSVRLSHGQVAEAPEVMTQ